MRPLPHPVMALADEETLGARLLVRSEAAVRGGLSWICLRARYSDTEERVRLGRALQEACPSAALTVHGDPEACRALGAPGLHLPSGERDLGALRRAFPETLLGVSCHTREELEEAEGAGIDYALLSPFFSPVSKPAGGPVLGPEGFREAVRGLSVPVVALGGVVPERVGEVAAAGAAGLAVLGALFLPSDVEGRAREFCRVCRAYWGYTPSNPTTHAGRE